MESNARHPHYVVTLTIAGSDPTAGAGIQADIKTMTALGCYAASAITAVTVQDTVNVQAIHAVPAEVVAAQVRAARTPVMAMIRAFRCTEMTFFQNSISNDICRFDIPYHSLPAL